MQKKITIKISDISAFKESLVEYARFFELACILDSNSQYFHSVTYNSVQYDLIAGYAFSFIDAEKITQLTDIDNYSEENNHWLLGYITYDLKNELENLQSNNPDYMKWPPCIFFKPDVLIFLKGQTVTIVSYSGPDGHEVIRSLAGITPRLLYSNLVELNPRLTKNEYLKRIHQIQRQIFKGDIYEVNFCLELFSNATIDPYSYFNFLNTQSPAPFASFFKVIDKFLLSLSPERYLKKLGDSIIMQPMKGTAPRANIRNEDDLLRDGLSNSLKERSENIMIVDLVRNDLSKIAQKNSVIVEELCKVYSFPQVHQMISSVRARLKTASFSEIIKATFPMGSMTGAPKIAAMKIIDDYEITKRGLYSGAVGYISPSSDIDLSVVIRSLQYNAGTEYLSYMVGSAITALSNPQQEYEECLLKAYGIKNGFNKNNYA